MCVCVLSWPIPVLPHTAWQVGGLGGLGTGEDKESHQNMIYTYCTLTYSAAMFLKPVVSHVRL